MLEDRELVKIECTAVLSRKQFLGFLCTDKLSHLKHILKKQILALFTDYRLFGCFGLSGFIFFFKMFYSYISDTDIQMLRSLRSSCPS